VSNYSFKKALTRISSDVVNVLGDDSTQRLVKLVVGTISVCKLNLSVKEIIDAIEGIEDPNADKDKAPI